MQHMKKWQPSEKSGWIITGREPEPALQKQWFRRQIELAKEVKLPIIVHSRDAADPTMQIIQETKAYECGGVIHCYSYSPEMAEEYVKMGFFIGMGGVLTFKNAKKLVRCAERISAVFYCVGNRLPVYGTGAKQRKAKRFVAAYLRGTEVSRN